MRDLGVIASAIVVIGCGTSSDGTPTDESLATNPTPSTQTTAGLSHNPLTGTDTLVPLPSGEWAPTPPSMPATTPAEPPDTPTDGIGEVRQRVWYGHEKKVEDTLGLDRAFRFNVKVWAMWGGANAGGGVCSGTIVGERTVLTAAHCVYDTSQQAPWAIRVAVAPAESDGYLPLGILAATNWVIDANYPSDTRNNDWAVLTLDRKIQLIAGGQPPFVANLNAQFDVWLTGYPADKDPRALQMWTDFATHPSAGAPNHWPDPCGNSNTISYSALGQETGDSGGGLYIPGYGIFAVVRGYTSCFTSGGDTLNLATLITPNRANLINNYAATHLDDPVTSAPQTNWLTASTNTVDAPVMMAAVPSHVVDIISVNDDTNAVDYTSLTGENFTSTSIGSPNNVRILGRPHAISRDVNRIDVFVEGNDRTLWTKAFDGASWAPSQTGWWSLGGITLGGAPTAVSMGTDRIDVFVRGADGAVWHNGWGGLIWGGWESLGGSMTGNVAAVSRAPGLVDLFVRGTDGTLWWKSWNGARWVPSTNGPWTPLGGNVADEPTAVSLNANRIDVFVRNDFGLQVIGGGQPDEYETITFQTSTNPRWGAWKELGGTMTSPVAAVASRGTNRLDIFGRRFDGALVWNKATDGQNWSGWQSLGGPVFQVAAFGNASMPLQVLGNDFFRSLKYKFSTDGTNFNPR